MKNTNFWCAIKNTSGHLNFALTIPSYMTKKITSPSLSDLDWSADSTENLLRKIRHIAKKECYMELMKATNPAFHPEVILDTNGTKKIRLKGYDETHGFDILKTGKIISHGNFNVKIEEIIHVIANKYSALFFEKTGLNSVSVKNKIYPLRQLKYDYSFDAYLHASYGKWINRTISRAKFMLKITLEKELHSEVRQIGYMSGATFAQMPSVLWGLNFITKKVSLYRQVSSDQPSALKLFHFAAHDYIVNNNRTLKSLPKPTDAVRWAKEIMCKKGLSPASWRYLLNCNPIEQMAWIGFFNRSYNNYHLPIIYGNKDHTYSVINYFVKHQIPVITSAIPSINRAFMNRLDKIDRIDSLLCAASIYMRRLHSQAKRKKLRAKRDILALLDEYNIQLITDYLMYSEETVAIPEKVGYDWLNKKQQEWHADVAKRNLAAQMQEAVMHEKRMAWSVKYPDEISSFNDKDMDAKILSSANDYVQEGVALNHCVANRIDEAIANTTKCYSVYYSEYGHMGRATVRLSYEKNKWHMAECRRENNLDTPERVTKFAKKIAANVNRLVLQASTLTNKDNATACN